MKKYLSIFLKVIGFILEYLLFQVGVVLVYSIIISIEVLKENRNLELVLKEKVGNNIFTLFMIAAIINFFVYILMFRNKNKNLFKRCKFNRINIRYIPKLILVIIGMTLTSVALVSEFGDIFNSYNVVQQAIIQSYNSIISMFSIIVVLPIFEEILFRGLVFYELRERFSVIATVIIQALIFGIWHLNPLQAVYTFFAGIIFGVILVFTNSIWGSIIAHIIYNLLGSLCIPALIYFLGDSVDIYMYIIVGIILFILGIILMYKQYKRSKRKYLFSNIKR
ncbi:CPBP family intramembrane glutamic endopeptidase [Eubacterium multiforme]|uniref:Membrane protease YdiL (CAAX protease family) n=1 Tax=Eubacterium multiforme TaxID=83339 RepID=A0ABT9UVI0_9FIRM|nr:type II CAAX endopeptidase family protein [Eubacterium multiforme]MDQ0150332.1 membrane protease YdiL (CAAX protease family) [Eubacterium multiforme]